MNFDISNAAQCYGLYDHDEIVAFIGVIHFPHPRNKKIKKVTRLVVLPDYQGIGLGVAFLNMVAEIYKDYDFRITTSAKNLIYALNKHKNWRMENFKRSKMPVGLKKEMVKTFRGHVKTASFIYVFK